MKTKQSLIGKTLLRLLVSSTIYVLSVNTAIAQSVADFALGGRNICAIDVNGSLECTTRFDADIYLPPADGTLYEDVASGVSHSCAITQGRELRCWGLNNFGQLDAPSVDVGFESLSASGFHTCAVDANGQAHCWGLNTANQTDVPEPNEGFLSVHTGAGSSCGLKVSGELVCWSSDTMITGTVPESPDYTDITLGDGAIGIQSCGLTQEGAIDCWASNAFSVEVPASGPYTQIGSNLDWLCGLTQDGILDCNFRTRNQTNRDAANQELFNQVLELPTLSTFDVLTQNSTITSICGVTLEGSLVCIGESLPANTLPGVQDNPLAELSAVENLSFAVYSDTTVELFWENNNTLFAATNIYRDSELLTVTNNGTSFIDDTLLAGQEYVYTVAVVDFAGFEGPLSAPIFVATNDRAQDGSDGDMGSSLSHPGQPTNISITRYGDSSLEIFWDRPTDFFNARYQVYRNGEFLAFAPGPSYFDDSVNADTAYFYTIVVLERTGVDVIGVGFVNEPAR